MRYSQKLKYEGGEKRKIISNKLNISHMASMSGISWCQNRWWLLRVSVFTPKLNENALIISFGFMGDLEMDYFTLDCMKFYIGMNNLMRMCLNGS